MEDEDRSSSPEQLEGQKVKKRRLHGACDTCRKRKTKCDSAAKPGNICTNCEIAKIHCTHDAPRQPKKKDTQKAYIRSLEERLAKMEQLVHALRPDQEIDNLLDLPFREVSESLSSTSDPITQSPSRRFPELKYPGPPHLSSILTTDGGGPSGQHEIDPVEEAHDLAHVELAEQMGKLCVEETRFFGQSSTYMFAKYTICEKNKADGIPCQPLDQNLLRRPLYWDLRPWELSFAHVPEKAFTYPESDLLNSLVSIYFEKLNIYLPILHRPTFIRSLHSGQHLRDQGFGMTVLLVCAVASRYSFDSRVLLDDDSSGLSSGWKYFIQVPIFRNQLFERSTLYDLQCYAISIIYLIGTSTPHVAWPVLGLGIRFALEKGLHRRKGKFQSLTVQDETANRVFWCLIWIDRWMSSFLGRPCALQDEEFDVEYPTECDDEYWEISDPEKAFKQPPGKPCKITSFIANIKLAEIMGFTLKTLYSTKKSKRLIGLIGNEWEEQIVAELDSSMNKWKDSLPSYLHWNPENTDLIFFNQSAAIHLTYYYLQIQIHRPFLTKRSALSLPSLAMCTNAARSTAHILEAGLTRGVCSFPIFHMTAFASALVLLLNRWIHEQSDPNHDSSKEMELVHKCFLALKEAERKWHAAGRLVDLLQMLGYLRETRANPQPKRRRESNADKPDQSQTSFFAPLWEDSNFLGRSLQQQTASPPATLESPGSDTTHSSAQSWGFSNTSMANTTYNQQKVSGTAVDGMFQVDNAANIPITQTGSFPQYSFGTNFQPSPPGQGPDFLDTLVQPSIEAATAGSNMTDDIFAMWSNIPTGFSTHEWESFLAGQWTESHL